LHISWKAIPDYSQAVRLQPRARRLLLSAHPPDSLHQPLDQELIHLFFAAPYERSLLDAILGQPAVAPAPQEPGTGSPFPVRRHKRYAARKLVRVRCETWQEFVTFYTYNISQGGVFVATGTPPLIDTPIDVQLQLPGRNQGLSLAARVAHVVSRERAAAEGVAPGMGVEFLNPDEIVALGAAMQCAIIDGAVEDVVLLDVTPHTLGI
jgi:uncharacterized protein (TIGR02266 family)